MLTKRHTKKQNATQLTQKIILHLLSKSQHDAWSVNHVHFKWDQNMPHVWFPDNHLATRYLGFISFNKGTGHSALCLQALSVMPCGPSRQGVCGPLPQGWCCGHFPRVWCFGHQQKGCQGGHHPPWSALKSSISAHSHLISALGKHYPRKVWWALPAIWRSHRWGPDCGWPGLLGWWLRLGHMSLLPFQLRWSALLAASLQVVCSDSPLGSRGLFSQWGMLGIPCWWQDVHRRSLDIWEILCSDNHPVCVCLNTKGRHLQ